MLTPLPHDSSMYSLILFFIRAPTNLPSKSFLKSKGKKYLQILSWTEKFVEAPNYTNIQKTFQTQ